MNAPTQTQVAVAIQTLREGIATEGTSLTVDDCLTLVALLAPDESDFEKELSSLINRHSLENASNTPDYILAQYVAGCLATFATAVQQRETWYGRDARRSSIATLEVAGSASR